MTPLQLLDRWGFCPFCVAIKDSQSVVTVKYKSGRQEEAPWNLLTRPVGLTEWLHDMITQDFAEFTFNQCSAAFIPVAVIAGVPLCTTHLWAETEPSTRRLRA